MDTVSKEEFLDWKANHVTTTVELPIDILLPYVLLWVMGRAKWQTAVAIAERPRSA